MSSLTPRVSSLFLSCVIAAACGDTVPSSETAAPDASPTGGGAEEGDGSALYDPTRIAVMELTISESDMALLYSDRSQPTSFEDFTYVPAELSLDGTLVGTIGIRVKGNSTRVSSRGDYMPYKLDADRFVDTNRIDGLKKVNLQLTEVPLVQGNTVINEYLAYQVWREAGMAAPRTGWVELHINGARVGLYTSVEQVSSSMLKRHFESGGGALYKPEAPSGALSDMGDDFGAYLNADYKGDEADANGHQAFLDFIDVINHQPPSAWDTVVDVDSVLGYFAGNVALANWDTYSQMQHNFYIYEGQSGVFSMLPWDMNEAFTASTAVCPNDVRKGGGPGGPGGPGGASGATPLHDALLADAEMMARYKEELESFLAGPASPESLAAAAEVAAQALAGVSTVDVNGVRSAAQARVDAIRAAMPSTVSCE